MPSDRLPDLPVRIRRQGGQVRKRAREWPPGDSEELRVWSEGPIRSRDGGALPLRPHIDPAIELPIQLGYTDAKQIIDAFTPRCGQIDRTTLSERIIAKLDRRNTLRWDLQDDQVRNKELLLKAVVLCGIAVAAISLGLWAAAEGATATATILLVCAIAAGVGAGALDFNRRRNQLDRQDLDVIAEAVVDWPSYPDELDAYPNSAALQAEWESRWQWRPLPGAAALVWREPHAVAAAELIAQDIRASRAWNSELLDLHRLKINLDETLWQIRVRAHRIWRVHANLVPNTLDEPNDMIEARNAEITAAANRAFLTLVDMVQQLATYRDQLAPLDRQIAEIQALQRSTQNVSDDDLRQLNIDAALNEMHTEAINAAALELAEVNANLQARLEFLQTTLAAPTNMLAITTKQWDVRH